MSLKHRFVSGYADGDDTTKFRPSDWGSLTTDYTTSSTHVFDGGALGSLLYRDTGASAYDGSSWLAAAAGVLTCASAGVAPSWSVSPSLPSITLSTPLVASSGGTGQSSYAIGDLLYASGATTLSKLAAVAIGQVLVSQGVATALAYSASPTLTAIILGDGSATTPAMRNATLTTTGPFWEAGPIYSISVGGTKRMGISTSAVTTSVPILTSDGDSTAPSHSFSSVTTRGFYNATAVSSIGVAGNLFFGLSAPSITFNTSGPVISVPSANTFRISTSGANCFEINSSGDLRFGKGAIGSALVNPFVFSGQPGAVATLVLHEPTGGGELVFGTSPATTRTWHIDNDTGAGFTPGARLKFFSQSNIDAVGTDHLAIDPDGVVMLQSTGVLAWSTGINVVTHDVNLSRLAADTLALRRSTNTQEFDIGPSGSDLRLQKANAGPGFIGTRDSTDLQLGTANAIRWYLAGSTGHLLAGGAFNIGDGAGNSPVNIYAESNVVIGGSLVMGATTITETEIGYLDGLTIGTVTASKALVVDANKDLATLRHLTISGNFVHGATTLTEAELAVVDGVVAGTVTASKALVVDANKDIATLRHLTISGNFITGSTTLTETEFGYLDGLTAGTVTASKALVVDVNKDLSSLRNLTLDSAGVLAWSTDVNLVRLGVDILGLRRGTSTQKLYVGPSGSSLFLEKSNGGPGYVLTEDGTNLAFGDSSSVRWYIAGTTGHFLAGGAVNIGDGAGNSPVFIYAEQKVNHGALTFATLPAAVAGDVAYITDSNTATWGATAAAGGANKVLVWYNGTNWTVVGA